MDHKIDKQEPSGTEGGEMKAGDFVWVKCKVIEPCESLIKVTPSGDDNWFYASRNQCRPSEPSNSPKILDSSSDPLAPSPCMEGVDADQFIEGVMEARGPASDPVNPSHYKHLPAEAIDIIEAAIAGAPSNKAAYLHGQSLKYPLRCWEKGGVDDLKKARWYLDRLIKEVGE
jgi:Protein of unknwon function (DUF3310)